MLGAGSQQHAQSRSAHTLVNGEPPPATVSSALTAAAANGPLGPGTGQRGSARPPAAAAALADGSDPEAGCCRAAAMRRAEFGRLAGTVYVDHAGTSLYSDRQLQEVYQVRPLRCRCPRNSELAGLQLHCGGRQGVRTSDLASVLCVEGRDQRRDRLKLVFLGT